MLPIFYQLQSVQEGFLAIMGRPRGSDWLEDEIRGLSHAGIHIVVSLLESHEIHELELTQEAQLCQQYGITYFSFPIQDRNVPLSWQETETLLISLSRQVMKGKQIVIHCRAGIGRSALMAACLLIHLGYTPEQAFDAITHDRRVPVPDTEKQAQWVRIYYDQYRRRQG